MNVELKLAGMHCTSCAHLIRETLEETAGVRRAEVSYDDRRAVVDFDERTVQPATLVRKIQDLNYQATIAGEAAQEGKG